MNQQWPGAAQSRQSFRAKIEGMVDDIRRDDPKQAFINDIWPALEDNYEAMRGVLEQYCKDEIKRWQSTDIRCQVSSRTKTADSIKKSLDRREQALQKDNGQQKFNTVRDVLREIHDLVGLRIVLEFPDDMDRAIAFIDNTFQKEREPTVFSRKRKVGKLWDTLFGAYQTRNYRVSLKSNSFSGSFERISQFCGILFEIQLTTLSEDLYNKLAHPLLYKNSSGRLSQQDEMVIDISHGLSICYAICVHYMKDRLANGQGLSGSQRGLKAITGESSAGTAAEDSQVIADVTRFAQSLTGQISGQATAKVPPQECHSISDLKEWLSKRLDEVNCPPALHSRVEWEDKLSTVKRHWIVPFGRNKEFVGRETILADLLAKILPSGDEDDCQRTAIEGLGGVGKTQIALEAAFRIGHAQPNCSVFWVPAVDATSFENTYRAIGQQLKIPGIDEEKADVKALVNATLSRESGGNWLLIIDNADDTKLLFGDTALADYLPFSRKGSILFTTRNHELGLKLVESKSRIILVEEMSKHEALEMLQKNLKSDQMSDIGSNDALLEFLANLPLAIRQASAYMAKKQISTTQYLELCKSSDEDMIELLSRDFEDRHRYKNIQNAVATTWLISFQQISDHDPMAADYLRFMCFLAGKDIPHSLLPPAGRLKTVEAIGTLKAYAFISQRNESDTYDIHRLVQVSMLRWLARKGERKEWTAKVLERLADVFPWPEHENREKWMRYLPHTQHALQLGKRTEDEKARPDLLSKIGESVRNLGKYEEAEQMHRQALQLTEKVLGKEHPDTLSSMNNLAIVLDSQGKYEEAEQIHRQALQLKEKVLGKEHPDTLSSMNNLAIVLDSQGKYEEAEQIHRQALQLKEKVLGKEHPDTLTIMDNLAVVLRSQGRYEEAEQMHRQALQLREKVLGKEHPDTLNSMDNLAVVLRSQGRYEEAEQMHRQALQLYKKVLGKEHPETLSSMNNLAVVLDRQGKYEEAEQMHRQALQLKEKVLGKEHPYTLASMNNLALVLDSQGKHEEAEQMHRQALQLKEKVLGKEHPDTLISINNLTACLRARSRRVSSDSLA